MAQVFVVANATAASGVRAAAGERVRERLEAAGHDVDLVRGADAGGAERALRAALAAGPPDAVVGVGGDGTMHLLVNVLAQTEVPLGIVATGSGNDLARSLGLPFANPEAATKVVLGALEVLGADEERGAEEECRADEAQAEAEAEGAGAGADEVAGAGADGGEAVGAGTARIRAIDLVHLGSGRWYAGVLSAGFDAAVNERANGMRWPRGRNRYVVALLLELLRLTPRRYRVTIDRDRRQLDAVLVTVGNTTSIGGGMRITPGAVLDDGLLNVMVAAPLSRRELLRIFPRVYRGTHIHDEHVSVERGRVVTVAVEGRDVPVAYADGERIGPLPITAEVVPGALRVLVP